MPTGRKPVEATTPGSRGAGEVLLLVVPETVRFPVARAVAMGLLVGEVFCWKILRELTVQ